MNLTFGVCWIEDQASDAEIEAVEGEVRANGFEPEIHSVETEADIEEFSNSQSYFHDYDLILLDLRLGEGRRGDDLAPIVRAAFRSTPILFYSAEAENNLRERMAEKLVEGVYCTHRDRLPTRVGELVADFTPALNRLAGMRGLAARVVAECDHELRTILLSWAENTISEDEIVGSLKSRVMKSHCEQKNDMRDISDLENLLDSHIIASGHLFREVYHRLGELADTDDIRAVRRSLRKYPELVLSRRNILAHALEERGQSGWRIQRSGSKPDLTVQDFSEYRSDFLAHLKGIRSLRTLLIS